LRYSNLPTLTKDRKIFLSTSDIKIDKNDFLYKNIEYKGERLDFLAYKHFGDGKYWYIIAMFNDITNPLVIDKATLSIPLSLRDVEDYISSQNSAGT